MRPWDGREEKHAGRKPEKEQRKKRKGWRPGKPVNRDVCLSLLVFA